MSVAVSLHYPRSDSLIRTLAFSRDGTHLAGGGDDGTIQDGYELVTVGIDATVRVRDTVGRTEPLVLDGLRAAASVVASLADGRYVTAHDDGTIRLSISRVYRVARSS